MYYVIYEHILFPYEGDAYILWEMSSLQEAQEFWLYLKQNNKDWGGYCCHTIKDENSLKLYKNLHKLYGAYLQFALSKKNRNK